ncbi:MAG: SCO family protein [Burkholderiales bacterium]|nr:SCO family protein [Burkholderiales bacterium]
MRTWFLPALLLVTSLLVGCAPETFRATDITGAEFARRLELSDHHGKVRGLADFRGKVVVVFFGYTHCPDVCPTTLAKLAEVAKSLGGDADKLQVLFITVDPERDTTAVLSRYVPAFDARFIGLTGDPAAIARTAKEFKVIYQKQPGNAPDAYSVDHSSGTFVFDPQGRVRLFVRHDQSVEDLVHDIRLLLRS